MDSDTVKLVRIPADTWRAVVEALEDAGRTAQALHGPAGWDIYWQHAPEMKRFRAAIALARKVSAE